MRADYLEQMRAHVDEGGKLSHQNGVDLLTEVERLTSWNAVLSGSLRTFGHHTSACRWNGGFDCSCGFEKITKAA
jgi:hypothetical protein